MSWPDGDWMKPLYVAQRSDTKTEPAFTSMTFMFSVVPAPEDPVFKLLPK